MDVLSVEHCSVNYLSVSNNYEAAKSCASILSFKGLRWPRSRLFTNLGSPLHNPISHNHLYSHWTFQWPQVLNCYSHHPNAANWQKTQPGAYWSVCWYNSAPEDQRYKLLSINSGSVNFHVIPNLIFVPFWLSTITLIIPLYIWGHWGLEKERKEHAPGLGE